MQQIKQSEATADLRRVPVLMVSSTDGITPVTSLTFAAGSIKVSKNGAASANHAGSVVEDAAGRYYYEATAAELNTLGYVTIAFSGTGARTYTAWIQVVAFSPYDAATLGLSSVSAIKTQTDQFAFTGGKVQAAITAAGDFVQAAADKVWLSPTRTLTALGAIWDTLTASMSTSGSIGKFIVDMLNAVKTKTDTLGGGAVTVTISTPVTAAGNLELVRGDDYFYADGATQTVEFANSAWPDLTGASEVKLTVRGNEGTPLNDTLLFDATDNAAVRVVGGPGTEQKVRFDLTNAKTATVLVGVNTMKFDVRAVLASGRRRRLARGTGTGIEEQTR